MTKYLCLECFEWKYEADLEYTVFLPDEHHRETLCKSCAEAYDLKIVEQILPSEEYWAQREDDKSQPPLDDSDPFAIPKEVSPINYASED